MIVPGDFTPDPVYCIDEQVRKDFEGGFVTRRAKERYNDKMGEDEKKEEGRRVYQLVAYNMAVDVIDGKIDRWAGHQLLFM